MYQCSDCMSFFESPEEITEEMIIEHAQAGGFSGDDVDLSRVGQEICPECGSGSIDELG